MDGGARDGNEGMRLIDCSKKGKMNKNERNMSSPLFISFTLSSHLFPCLL